METITSALPVYKFSAISMEPTKEGNVMRAKGENDVSHYFLSFSPQIFRNKNQLIMEWVKE